VNADGKVNSGNGDASQGWRNGAKSPQAVVSGMDTTDCDAIESSAANGVTATPDGTN
jgi:hypothetical protein